MRYRRRRSLASRDDGYDLTDRILEWRLLKRDRPHTVSTIGLLLAPHPGAARRAVSAIRRGIRRGVHQPDDGTRPMTTRGRALMDGDEWMTGTSSRLAR